MTAIQQLAKAINGNRSEHSTEAIKRSRHALIDTIACMFAGSNRAVTVNALKAVSAWGNGDSIIVGRSEKISPPFAAMVNGASAHALDYDDFDEPANALPSAVIFPNSMVLR